MKKYRQDLSYEAVAAVLAYDPLTGVITFKHASRRSPAGRPAGRKDSKGYLRTRLGNAEYKNHRLAWLLHNGVWPKLEIDHINGDPADNRIANLRDVPAAVNGLNRKRAMSNNVVGVLGVSPADGGFVAQLKVGPVRLRSAVLPTVDRAAAVYAAWKQQYAVV